MKQKIRKNKSMREKNAGGKLINRLDGEIDPTTLVKVAGLKLFLRQLISLLLHFVLSETKDTNEKFLRCFNGLRKMLSQILDRDLAYRCQLSKMR